jgi:hypothetical protein
MLENTKGAIKSGQSRGNGNIVLWDQTPPLCEIMWSYKCFQYNVFILQCII